MRRRFSRLVWLVVAVVRVTEEAARSCESFTSNRRNAFTAQLTEWCAACRVRNCDSSTCALPECASAAPAHLLTLATSTAASPRVLARAWRRAAAKASRRATSAGASLVTSCTLEYPMAGTACACTCKRELSHCYVWTFAMCRPLVASCVDTPSWICPAWDVLRRRHRCHRRPKPADVPPRQPPTYAAPIM